MGAGALAAQNAFSLAHPEFYETLSHYPLTPEYVDRLKLHLAEGWTLTRSDVWVQASRPGRGDEPFLPQGFKIHVSASPAHAPRVLDVVAPACVERGLDFKIAGDPVLLNLLNSKLQGRGQSGKFMTIYPPDDAIFVEFIEHLHQLTRGEGLEGPYILSDRRYRDSRILFYRYGGFHPPSRLEADGTRNWFLVAPDGELVPDQRLPYFHLPPWVRDPFVDTSGARPEGETLLNGRYRIDAALSFSNAGGVYSGVETSTGRKVVVKEARPFTNCWTIGEQSWDSVHLLAREHRVLQRLEGLDFVPAPIDLFREWEHTFLVEEHVEGVALDGYWAGEDVLLAPYVRRPGRIRRFMPLFKRIAEQLVEMVSRVHERGVLLGDLSPRNVLIDPVTHRLSLIDFESAVLGDDGPELLAYATGWGTPGFVHPDRTSRAELLPVDDLYAVGMILYGSIVPANYLFVLHPAAAEVFLDRFIALGVPGEVKTIVDALLAGDAETARASLEGWDVAMDSESAA